jgi:DNA-directed RNA polymerase II subunit RPB2
VVKSKRIAHAKEILMKEFLPHMGIEAFQEEKKAYFLGYMVHRLLLVAMGRHTEDDRDHFGVKRMDMAGPLMSTLFRDFFKKLTKEVYLTVKKHADANREINIPAAVNPHTISKGFRFALATGNWSDQKGANAARAGVSQVLQRLTFTSTLSHLRRLNSPIDRSGKLAKPRQLHNTHWGMICPAETPEGQAVGLVKNLALMAYISVGSSAEVILEFLETWNTEVRFLSLSFYLALSLSPSLSFSISFSLFLPSTDLTKLHFLLPFPSFLSTAEPY